MNDEAIVDDNVKPTVSLDADSSSDKPFSRRRLEKIHQHLAETLESADTLQACTGPVCCDLLEVAQNLKAKLDEALACDRLSADKFERLMPTMRLYLKIVQQFERLAKLEVRIKEAHRLDNQQLGQHLN